MKILRLRGKNKLHENSLSGNCVKGSANLSEYTDYIICMFLLHRENKIRTQAVSCAEYPSISDFLFQFSSIKNQNVYMEILPV